jgi:hypothetical protein
MIRNLLALLLTLQKTTLDDDTQRYLLPQLGNKLEAISHKEHPNEQDRQNVQTKINNLLSKNPTLTQDYQQLFARLQTWTDAELGTLLPQPETIKSLQPQQLPILGYRPDPFSPNKDELENIIVVVSQIILRHENPAEMSKKLLSQSDKLTAKQ